MDKINAEISGDGYHKDHDGGAWVGVEYHRFKVTLEFEGRTMGLTFKQGVGIDRDPTAQDVLECVLADYVTAETTFEDWAGDYGYDTDSRGAERIFNACREQSAEFERMMMGEHLPTIIGESEENGVEQVAEMWAGVTS